MAFLYLLTFKKSELKNALQISDLSCVGDKAVLAQRISDSIEDMKYAPLKLFVKGVCPRSKKDLIQNIKNNDVPFHVGKSTNKKNIPKKLRMLVWNKYIGKEIGSTLCPMCKSTEIIQGGSWHCSHIEPESKGGKTVIDNLRALCGDCNMAMGDTDMREYASKFGFDHFFTGVTDNAIVMEPIAAAIIMEPVAAIVMEPVDESSIFMLLSSNIAKFRKELMSDKYDLSSIRVEIFKMFDIIELMLVKK